MHNLWVLFLLKPPLMKDFSSQPCDWWNQNVSTVNITTYSWFFPVNIVIFQFAKLNYHQECKRLPEVRAIIHHLLPTSEQMRRHCEVSTFHPCGQLPSAHGDSKKTARAKPLCNRSPVYNWLVVEPTPLKKMSSSVGIRIIIPNISGNIRLMFQTTNQYKCFRTSLFDLLSCGNTQLYSPRKNQTDRNRISRVWN